MNIYTNLVTIKPGKFTFDFKFKPPQILEPSFEFPGKGNKAYIRYFLSSNIISPYTKATTFTYIILKKRRRIEINKQVILIKENNVHKLGMFDGGKTKLKVTSLNGTDNFRFGEDIKFNIDIDNSNGKMDITECKIVLKRNVKFMNRFGQLKKDMLDELSSTKIKTESSAGEHKNFSYTLSLKNIQNKNFVIPGSGIPYNNFSDINYFLPSLKTNILECSYTIKFTLYFNLFVKFNERPRIIFNAIICHQSLDEGKAEMEQKLNLIKKNTMPNMQNNILPLSNMVPSNMAPPPCLMTSPKESVCVPINYRNPPQQINHMMINNMNNIQDEELPTMEEVESSHNINNNNIDYNCNNNYNNESFLHVNKNNN